MNTIDTIIILAATEGNRIKPISNYIPKILLPIIDKPIIVWHLERAESIGIKKAIIIIDDKKGIITKKSLELGYAGNIEMKFIVQKNRNGFLYSILLAKPYMESTNFIVALGDEYDHSGDFYKRIKKESKNVDVCLSLVQNEKNIFLTADEDIQITKNNKVLSYKQSLINKGVWIFGGIFLLEIIFLILFLPPLKAIIKKNIILVLFLILW